MVKPGHQKICTPESHCSGCRAVDACVPAENPGLLNTRLLPVFVPRNLKGIRLNDPAAGLLSASYALTKIMCIVLHFFLFFLKDGSETQVHFFSDATLASRVLSVGPTATPEQSTHSCVLS